MRVASGHLYSKMGMMLVAYIKPNKVFSLIEKKNKQTSTCTSYFDKCIPLNKSSSPFPNDYFHLK